MGRMQLVELEDLPWWPESVRNGATDWLAVAGNQTALPYVGFVKMLAEGLRSTGDSRLVDLCSGGGGPLPTLQKMLREQEGLEVTATLTDLYPNAERLRALASESDGAISLSEQPVDATDVPASLVGFRTLTNAFHHFSPDAARGILADAVAKRQGIAIMEVVERTPVAVLGTMMGAVLGGIATPFLKPFRPSRLLLSWGVPLIPFTILFDGIVSCLRVYSVDELRALVREVPGSDGYRWDIKRIPTGPMATTVLVGVPKTA